MDELNSINQKFIETLLEAVKKGGAVHWQTFARLTGTSETPVKKAWTNGDLPSCPVESIPVREGVVALCSIPGCLRRAKSTAVPQFLADADAVARELLGLPERVIEEPCQPGQAASEIEDLKIRYLKAQTAARAAQAVQRQMENDIKKGIYVKAADVELDAATTAASIAGIFNRFPARVSGMCEGRTADEIAAILQKEIRAVFDEIQASAFTGDWGAV